MTFLKSAVEENPEFGDIISAMSGMPFLEALARYVDIESLVPPEGAPDYEGYQGADLNSRKPNRLMRNYPKKRESNQEMSVATFGELMTEVGAEDEDVSKFLSHMDGVLADLADGLMSKDFFPEPMERTFPRQNDERKKILKWLMPFATLK